MNQDSSNINFDNNQSYERAKKRVENLRKFYKHLTTYVVINLLISFFKVRKYYGEGDTLTEAILNFDTLIVWGVWGLFLLFHAYKTFIRGAFLGTDWEEKKIKEIMNNNN